MSPSLPTHQPRSSSVQVTKTVVLKFIPSLKETKKEKKKEIGGSINIFQRKTETGMPFIGHWSHGGNTPLLEKLLDKGAGRGGL